MRIGIGSESGSVKIAVLGNMNNNAFALVRYLRDRGLDADALLFDNEAEHFQPSADSYDDSDRSVCRTLSWGNPAGWGRIADSVIERDLRDYPVIIGNGLAPAFCLRVGRAVDIFVPYGGDLFYYTRYHLTYPNRLPGTWRAVHFQRRAIPRCSIFHMDKTNDLYEQRWAEYRGASERLYCGIPSLYTGVYNPANVGRVANRTRWAREFARIRAESDLLLFSHVRHVWGGPATDPGQKGTDRLLRGLALFTQRHPDVNVRLITFEYGTCIAKSKALVRELGLEPVVHWFPVTHRKDLMPGILNADIVCAEFENSWLSSGVVYEALVMEKPIIGFRNDRLYGHPYPHLYSIMNAQTPDAICARFEEYLSDPSPYRTRGVEGRRWYDEYVVEPTFRRYLAFFAERAARSDAAS